MPLINPLTDREIKNRLDKISIVTITASILFYFTFVPLLFKPFGGAVVGFIAVPVMIVSWHAGMKGGFITGFASGLFVNSFMLALLYNEWVFDVLLRHQGIPGVIMLTFLGGGSGYFRELRDRYVCEIEKRMAAQRELEESVAGFETLFRKSSEGLYLIDPQSGSYIEVNPSFCSITGYDREELLEMHGHTRLIAPCDRDTFKPIMRLFKNGESIDNLQAKIIRKDGRERFVIFGATPIIWKGRKVLYGFMRDITPLKRMQLELERKNREMIDLTNTIAHDLRNPLTGVKGILELHYAEAKEKKEEKEEAIDALALKEIDYMQGLLEDMLELSRVDSDFSTSEWKQVALDSLVGKITELLKPQMDRRKIRFSFTGSGIRVLADERSLEKVLMNLIGNAIAYMGAQPNPSVSVSCHEDEKEVTVKITDNGMGIPEESLPFIFEKFRRGSNVGSIKGSGLGLSIVKKAVEAHGGTIRVESKVGTGSTFVFTIPRRKVSSADSAADSGNGKA